MNYLVTFAGFYRCAGAVSRFSCLRGNHTVGQTPKRIVDRLS